MKKGQNSYIFIDGLNSICYDCDVALRIIAIMKKQSTDRIDTVPQVVHNKLPDHEERLQAHCKRVEREYFRETGGEKPKVVEPSNQNLMIMIVEKIEGLLGQVNENIEELEVLGENADVTNKRTILKGKAFEEIDLFQKTTLFELRRCFE